MLQRYYKLSRVVIFATLPLWCLKGFAGDFDRFVGHYSGSAEVVHNGETTQRDMSVEIKTDDKGYSVNWKSIIHKLDGRIKEKEYTIRFVPTEREGIFSSAMKTSIFGNLVPLDPMKGEPYVWSTINGDTLIVYSMRVDEAGGYEMQEYIRTLTEGGLDLKYKIIRNGEKLKSIQAFLKRM